MTVASLADLLRPPTKAQLLRAATIAGPAFAVSVGYIDPGNWATDIAAGRYGYALLWTVVLASLMAMVVQALVVRLTFATEESLAASIGRCWPRARPWAFTIFTAGVVATDVAEFTGVVVGLRLLFGLSNPIASLLGVIGVVLLLLLGNRGLRRTEIALMSFVAAIALGYVYELSIVGVHVPSVLRGALLPTIPAPGAIAIMVGIIGATVMPHNLFLHSAFIVDRFAWPFWKDRATGVRWFTRETIAALSVALLINAAILIVGAVIGGSGSIEEAYRTIAPIAGGAAALVFGGTLLCAGFAASTTATIAGDVIAKDLSPIAMRRTARRLLTLAPAVALMMLGVDATSVLIWSQVVLALTLPAVLIPVIAIARRREVQARLTFPPALLRVAIVTTVVCIAFDAALVFQPLFARAL